MLCKRKKYFLIRRCFYLALCITFAVSYTHLRAAVEIVTRWKRRVSEVLESRLFNVLQICAPLVPLVVVPSREAISFWV